MKLFDSLILFILSFVFTSSIIAQNNALIMGKLVNTSMVNNIELKIDKRYLNGSTDNYYAQVLSDNSFAFAIQVDRPQKVKLVYSRNVVELYIEPNDTLYVNGDANTFPFNLSYSSRSGHNNQFLEAFQKEYPKHKNEFEYTQYRSGLYWYIVPPDLDGMMQRMSIEGFTNSMTLRRDNRLQALEDYDKENPKKLTKQFKEYMFAEIYYEFGYYMLCYGDIFKNKHYIGKEFFHNVADIPLDSKQMGSQFYREYTKAFVNHKYMEVYNNDVAGIINRQYDLAPSYLAGMPLAYFRSDIIAKALYGKKVDVILDKYNDFLLNNIYYEFNDKVTIAYQKAIKYHIGSPAPSFNLVTKDGQIADLKSYAGKPVFINFWASWCHSCMKKMDKMKDLQAEMEEKGMVFLNISFDRSQELWTETIAEKGYGGTHVFLEDGVKSHLAIDYNVRALPQYYLIDKKGNFAKTPAKGDLLEMKQIMEKLLR